MFCSVFFCFILFFYVLTYSLMLYVCVHGLELELTLCCHMLSIAFVFGTYIQTSKQKVTWGMLLKMSSGGLHMQKIMSMDEGAHNYLSGLHTASWSKHAFGCHSKNNMLLNNLAKSFNAWIKDAWGKPIHTMIEDICQQIMTCFYQKRDGIRASQFSICPKI